MAESATLIRRKADRADGISLSSKLANDVEAVLEATERTHNDGRQKTGRLNYQIPQAGVRYYSLPRVD